MGSWISRTPTWSVPAPVFIAFRWLRDRLLLHDSPINVEPLSQIKLHSPEQHLRFQSLAGGDNLLERPIRSNVETALGDDGAFVEAHRYKMRSDADDFDPLLEGLTIGLRPRKTGQQRGVYVDDFVFVSPD